MGAAVDDGTEHDPASIGEISAGFLRRVLADRLQDPSVRVQRFEVMPEGRGFGSLSIHRFRIGYRGRSGSRNLSLILKTLGSYVLPTRTPKETVDRYRTDQRREMEFYKGGLGVPLPACLHRPEPWYIIDNPATGQLWIFMEDLGEFLPGPVQTAANALRAVSHLAAMHAQWWGKRERLVQFHWLSAVNQDIGVWEGISRLKRRENFERASKHPRLRSLYTKERLARLHRLMESWPETHRRVEALPLTLIHGDFGTHNFGFREVDGAGQTILVDWDQMGLGSPGMELGRSNWLPVLLGAEYGPEEALIDTYCRSLEMWLAARVDRDAVQQGYDLYFCLGGLFVLAFYAVGEGPAGLRIPLDLVYEGSARVLAKIERAAARWLG